MPHLSPTGRRTLTVTYGLQGSGKSTLARQLVRDAAPGALVRVNKDDLRAQLHAGRHAGRVTESQVLAARDRLVSLYLDAGVDVIVDDTNLAPAHGHQLAALAWEHGADFTVLDLTDVPVAECIRRDAERAEPVGEQVIRRTARLLDQPRRTVGHDPIVPAPAADPALPDVTLCDIDGTLAQMTDRGPYEWHRVGEDRPSPAVVDHVRALVAAGRRVMVFSGRDGSCRPQTEAWLAEHVAADLELHMRAAGDNRRDSFVKYDLFNAHVRGRFNVTSVLDDRDQVVRTWRTLGLVCFQVAPGAF